MKLKTLFSIVQLVLAFLGFFDASLLYFAHGHEIELPCTVGSGGCGNVNSSPWSEIGHIPIAAFGALAYCAVAVLAIVKLGAESDRGAALARGTILVVALAGAAYSWYLQYVAAAYIHAYCPYCRASAFLITLILLLAICESIAAGRRQPNTAAQPIAPVSSHE